MAEVSNKVAELVRGLTPDEIEEIAAALGLRKAAPRVAKEASPEYQAAKATLDAIVAENPDLIKRYDNAKETLRGIRGERKVLATKRYDGKKLRETGQIIDLDGGTMVAEFGAQGWQSAMRSHGFTQGQVAAVSKEMKKATTPA